jgi:pimeloyl-ACP methyl ester carboxylesterase
MIQGGSPMSKRVPRFTLDGVKNAEASVHPFSTDDGLGLYLTRFRRPEAPGQSRRGRGGQGGDVVLLIHGLTSSSDMYIMPEQDRNLVEFLLDNGFEAWTLDFRMSSRFPYDTETHRFTIDDAAKYDHPAALRELRRHIGDRPVHVIAHCLGSMSFAMSLAAGKVDGITSMISNGVALVPRVPRWSQIKLTAGPAVLEYLLGFSFLDPRYALTPPLTRPWLLSRLVSLFHHECDVRTCHMLSFMWGSGKPGMYLHDNLIPETHERMHDLCSATGVHYYRHIAKMVRAGHAVKYDPGNPDHDDLPDDYLASAANITTPILFLTGDHNRVFIDSNVDCYKKLAELTPGLHELEIIPGYGHQDMVMGRHSHRDVFPRLLDFLRKHSGGTR